MLKDMRDDLPEAFPYMNLDGFTPEQILMATRKSMTDTWTPPELPDGAAVIWRASK